MISFAEARTLIRSTCLGSKKEERKLVNAGGLILAENIQAPIDTPPFEQSAMDGYAFAFEKFTAGKLNVIGEVAAGEDFEQCAKANEAVRIFTGAALPKGTDTVVMQENVSLSEGFLFLHDEKLQKGSNVRHKGSQTKQGDYVLKEKQILTPAALSFLANLGIEKVQVFSPPDIAIIITGNELLKPGEQLIPGKIYESNSTGLITGLQQLGISPVSVEMVDDREAAIIEAVKKQERADILILTGGVSVGDYDFVTSALQQCGVHEVFHKVKQKPGKPLYFGRLPQGIVFGLPGNPASVLSCFYEYVVPAIGYCMKKEIAKKIYCRLVHAYTKKKHLTYFLKGKTNGAVVTILANQESYLLNSYAEADCLVELEEGKEYFHEGEIVPVQLIL